MSQMLLLTTFSGYKKTTCLCCVTNLAAWNNTNLFSPIFWAPRVQHGLAGPTAQRLTWLKAKCHHPVVSVSDSGPSSLHLSVDRILCLVAVGLRPSSLADDFFLSIHGLQPSCLLILSQAKRKMSVATLILFFSLSCTNSYFLLLLWIDLTDFFSLTSRSSVKRLTTLGRVHPNDPHFD